MVSCALNMNILNDNALTREWVVKSIKFKKVKGLQRRVYSGVAGETL